MQTYILSLCMLCIVKAKETFDEELLIKDIGSGYSAFHFNFVSKIPEYVVPQRHHNIIPISISKIFEKFRIDELHLSMVRGFWDGDLWGPQFVASAPSGAELLAWFKENTTDVDRSWFELTHALSGQFCASLNRLSTRQHSVIPTWAFRKTGISAIHTNTTNLVRYAQMPEEALCSENFTPWVKLLPCKGLAGLASVLLPTSIFRANFNGLTVSLRRICWDSKCSYLGLELRQTITIVFDRRLLYGAPENPWSLKGLLGRNLQQTCDPAHSSRIFILSSPSGLSWTPSNLRAAYHSPDDRVMTVYDSKTLLNGIYDSLLFNSSAQRIKLPQLVSLSKLITGSGSIDGGVRSIITSRADFPITLVYLDTVPWFTKVFFSSLHIELFSTDRGIWERVEPVKYVLQPSLARKRMATIELVVVLPPGRQLAICYKFRKTLQRWDEFNPDANHGYSLAAASVSYQLTKGHMKMIKQTMGTSHSLLALPNWVNTYAEYLNNSESTQLAGDYVGLVRIYSPIVLVTMPLPDFSMPFNVLCFVCSVVAIVFGAVLKSTAVQLTARLPAPYKVVTMLNKLRQKLRYRSSAKGADQITIDDTHEKTD